MEELKINRFAGFAIIFAIWAGIYLPGLGDREVHGNEPKRILPALTMIETGNWLTPELVGEKYYRKPPLINWMIASSIFACGGYSEFAARLPSALAILVFALMTVAMRSGWLDDSQKFVSAIFFLTAAGSIDKGRLIEIDAAYASFTGMALLAWLNLRSLNSSKWVLWILPAVILGFGLLLKGPLILLVFYITVTAFLFYERKIGELASKAHVAGFILMSAIFLLWAGFAYSAKSTVPVSDIPSPKMTREWFSDIGDVIFGMDNFSPAEWFGNVICALFYFLPWIFFLPLLWNKKWTALISGQHKNIFKGCVFSLAAGFVLIALIPGTRSRYFTPLIPLASVLVGFITFQRKSDVLNSIWKNTLLFFSCLLGIVTPVCGMLIVHNGLIYKVLKFLKANPTARFEPGSIYTAFAVAAAMAAMFILMLKFRNRLKNPVYFSIFSGILTAAIMLQYSCFILPVEKMFDMKKPVGKSISNSVPEGETVYLFDFAYQPFVYYINRPVKYVFGDAELDKVLSEGAKYILFEEESFGRRKDEPHISSRRHESVLEFEYKKLKYKIFKFQTENAAGKKMK